jgi:hypothetical protein
MKLDWMIKVLLVAVIVLLGVIALRPVVQPPPVAAQASDAYPFYIEPGFTTIRKPDGTAQMFGKVVVDMRTGDIWGFPTLTQSIYPVDPAQSAPPKSHPIYLGKFLFSEAQK